MSNSYDSMATSKDNSGRGAKKRAHLSDIEGEKDETYRMRREKNNEAVRKSRDKSKKKTEETLQRVNNLKMENHSLETNIKMHRKLLADLKAIFLAHAASGKVSADIDIDAILKETEIEADPRLTSLALSIQELESQEERHAKEDTESAVHQF